jgi:adenylosuccinate lyase
MIPRYTPPDFAELWSDRTRYRTWLKVELAACEAMERAGLVPKDTAASIRALNLDPDPAAIEEIEARTKHDVIAFLTHIEQVAGEPARWLHRGMTSNDVLDSSFSMLLSSAGDRLLTRSDALIKALARRAEENINTVMIGRSHGIHAEPTTFGVVLAGHLAEVKRARARLAAAKQEVACGKIAGAVGTYAHLSPEIELDALTQLGLVPETVPTQVVARDRHAAFFSALALMAAAIERLSTNIRHWQRTEVGEVEERFSKGQKGSSAMPHKRNPILSENLCGLARIVRAAVTPALENISLWHERDISHSSVERMLAPDATSTLAFMLDRAAGLVEGLVVYADRMRQNLERSGGLYFSEAIMLELVGKGLARQKAYEMVQRNAMQAFAGEGAFEQLLLDDPEIGQYLSASEVRLCFDLKHALRYAEVIVRRAIDA